MNRISVQVILFVLLMVELSAGIGENKIISAEEVRMRANSGQQLYFDGSTIVGDLNLSGLKIVGSVHFNSTIFLNSVNFSFANISGPSYFIKANFQGPAQFFGSEFVGPAFFSFSELKRTNKMPIVLET